MPGKDAKEKAEALDMYGAIIPYADPSWYQSVSSTRAFESDSSLNNYHSITVHILMSLTLHFERKSVNGWKRS